MRADRPPPGGALWRWRWTDELRRDLRDAVRFLVRAPAFTVPAAASLAIAIAVNTTVFGVVNAALLRPLGQAGDLVRIGRSEAGDRQFRSLTYAELEHLREHASSFGQLVGHQLEAVVVAGRDGGRVAAAELVAGPYFRTLGVPPRMGREFSSGEDRAGVPVAVISHRFWRLRLGADPSVVGAAVRVNGHPVTIVGIAPPGFAGTFPGVGIDLWIPATAWAAMTTDGPRRESPSLLLLGKLQRGVTIATARAELETIARRLAQEDPARDRDRAFAVASARGVHPAFAEALRAFLGLMMGIVAVVLLIACANVAGMLLARASARRRELAVRLACGASRSRIVVQLMVESVVLAALGAGAGVAVSAAALRALNAFSLTNGPTGAPIFFDFRLDVAVIAFTAGAAVIAALVFGLVPSLRASRVDLSAALKGSPSMLGRARSRLRGALVAVQVGLSFVLLVAAALLFRSMRNSAGADVGFEPDRVVVASFDPQMLGYDRSRAERFYDDLLRRARAVAGFEQAALAAFVPMGDAGDRVGVAIPDRRSPTGQEYFPLPYNRVSDGYFATVGQSLVRGRDFTARDRDGAAPVAIVNAVMARRFWSGEDPLGKRVRLEGEPGAREIVGVARDARFASLRDDVGPLLYIPVLQRYGPRLTLHVRTGHVAGDALAALGRLARETDPDVAPHRMQTMREAMAFTLVPVRVAEVVFGVAGAIALLLAAGGLYGLVSFTLEQRMKEIGIRIALGASRRGVFGVIAGSAVRLAASGVAIGAIVAAVATRLVSALLYGLSPTDPLTFAAIGLLLVLVTLAAGYAAARRGLDVDPVVVLRQEA